MIFCGGMANTTLELAEEAAKAVNKILSVSAVNDDDENDEMKYPNATTSIESMTCNTIEAHGTYSSQLDLGNMDSSSLDIFAERIRVSTAEATKDKYNCSWSCFRRNEQGVGETSMGGLRFVPYEDNSISPDGIEKQQMAGRGPSRGLKLRKLEKRWSIRQRTPDSTNAKNTYPSEIHVYKPKRTWDRDGPEGQVQLQISWSVDRNLEMGRIDQWTGCLLRDNVTIGRITMYSISQRISRKPLIDDPAVVNFVESFILPINNRAGDETSGPWTENHRLRTFNLCPRATAARSKKPAAARLSLEGGGIMTLSRMIAIGPIFLVTDIIIQPTHRGFGLGLFLLDGACRRVAESFSLVIVSLGEAADEQLKIYFALLGFSALDGCQDFVGRRNSRHSPCIEDICPYLPAPTGFIDESQPNFPILS